MIVSFDDVETLVIDSDGKLRAKIKAELCDPKGESHYYMITGSCNTEPVMSYVIICLTRTL